MSRQILFAIVAFAALTCRADDDVDRTDFSDPALQEDKKILEPQGPHSDVEPTALLPDAPDGKVPVGVSSNLLVSIVNGGRSMFNVTGADGVIEDVTGKQVGKLARRAIGENLGPREQRSYLFPFTPDAKLPPGEYRIIANVYYANRNKDQFVSLAFNETAELVPAPPSPADKQKMARIASMGAVLLVVLGIVTVCFGGGGGGSGGGSATKKSKTVEVPVSSASDEASEWLKGTLAGSEGSPSKKKKKK